MYISDDDLRIRLDAANAKIAQLQVWIRLFAVTQLWCDFRN